ncbi:hypothetical protein RKE29_08870 [Streptomyces sp. B1866]|uniref:hypothetical protein n=1 Tax=Streptomyces sp. B1866 TaxID=3075431 RepID=UPI00288DDC82|nr:hypothetical protein [Streptomyces sp. B1866]MDT3396751.1 hypothetical protein [Streptomyces sp. B1866]
MPLHVPPAPAPALRSVLTALGSRAVRETRPSALSSLATPVEPELPLPVHILDDIAGTGGPPLTRLTGWRFLVRGGDRLVAVAETMLTADGWAFSHFCEGPYVTSTEQALRQAEALPDAYQPRLLSVPELYMLTLWLRRDPEADPAAGGLDPDDLLIPLAPAPPGIAAHREHRAADLLPVLTHRLTPAPLLGSPV